MLTNNNLHIVRIDYKTKTEVKQAVRKKINISNIYIYELEHFWFNSSNSKELARYFISITPHSISTVDSFSLFLMMYFS